MAERGSATNAILTIGHSTRTADELIALLRAHGVELLADVRRFPGSRRQPQFAFDALAEALPAAGVGYLWLPSLGGRRPTVAGSPNGGWRNPSFRAYADHLDSEEFAEGLTTLLGAASVASVCIMCSEALPWRCHRWLIADALTFRGVVVGHIIGPGAPRPHGLSSFAHSNAGRITYPPAHQPDSPP